MRYIDRIFQQGVTIPLDLAPPVGGVALRRQNVARVRTQGEFPWRVVLQPFTFIEPFNGAIQDLTVGLPERPSAIVSFGSDGVQQTAVVDWPVHGGMFSVWGDSVVVDVSIPSTWVTLVAPASVACGAAITPDAVGGAPRATRTRSTTLVVSPGFSSLVEVPPFARGWRWHEMVNTLLPPTPVPIAWQGLMDSAGVTISQRTPNAVYTSSETTWPSPDGITLSPDTRFVRLQSNAALGQDVLLAVEYVLDLG